MMLAFGSQINLDGLGDWGPPILLISFNIGDLVGKYISNYRYTFNGTFLYLLVLIRFGFFVLFIMIKTQSIN